MLRSFARVALGLLVVVAGALLFLARCDHPAAEVEARWARPPSTFVTVDGQRVHARDRGQGPALVLLHGSNASLFTWEGWSLDLSRDHRVISLDLPGHGLTGPSPSGQYGPRAMADLLDHLLTSMHVDRFALAGNSMGGHVALVYTLAHPDRVTKLILVDSAGYPREEPRPLALRLAGWPVAGEIVRWVTPRFVFAASLRDTFGDPSRLAEATIDLYDDLNLREGNRAATRARLSAPEDGDAVRRLAELHLPVLILWGARDRWILPRYGERFHAAIAGSRLVVLDGLGHIPMEEAPTETARLAREFLAASGAVP